jgi:hypothetical protein
MTGEAWVRLQSEEFVVSVCGDQGLGVDNGWIQGLPWAARPFTGLPVPSLTRRPTAPGELALPPTVSRSLGRPGRRDPSFREGLLQSLDTRRADPRPVEVEAFEGLESRQRLD